MHIFSFITTFVIAHLPLVASCGWVIGVLISQMPAPMPGGNQFYKYAYTVLHIFAANADKFVPLLKEFAKVKNATIKSIAIIALCLLTISAAAQTPSPSPAPSATPAAIQNFYAGGISYGANASPSVAGTGLYAHQVVGSTGTYAFTVIDFVPASYKPLTVTSNIGAGVAQKTFTIANFPIYTTAAAGFSWSGPNAGWNWSAGGMAPIKIKGNYYIAPMIRVLKTNTNGGSGVQPIFGILIGFGK
jgi:hypothetical protein